MAPFDMVTKLRVFDTTESPIESCRSLAEHQPTFQLNITDGLLGHCSIYALNPQ